MASRQGTVRIGPVSILVVIIILCLAVMSVLALVTAEAEESITARQEESTTAMYANEVLAQEFLAQLDAKLARAHGTETSVRAVLDQVGLPEGAVYEDGVLHLEFVQENGRRLDVELALPNTDAYEILAWRATTEWNEEDPDKIFWSAP